MTTLAELIAVVRAELMGSTPQPRNRLSTAYTAGSGTLGLEFDPSALDSGQRLSIGLNTFHVWSRSGNSFGVSGGEEGTTDADAADGSTVLVAPRWTDHQIMRAINAELLSLSAPAAGLYRVQRHEFTVEQTKVAYDFPGSALSIYDVRVRQDGPWLYWTRPGGWDLERNADTDDFPSGASIRFRLLGDPGIAGQPVEVLYKSAFTPFTTLAGTVAATGLQASAEDILVLGAQVRMISGREMARNYIEEQGQPRRAAEVGAGAVLRSIIGLEQLRERRLREERSILTAAYPPREA